MPQFGSVSALKQELTPMLLLITMLSSWGAWTVGWDNSWWSGIMGNSYFGERFGALATTKNGVTTYSLSATQQSTGTGLGTAGIMVGCMIAGQVAHWGGRKLCFYVVAMISIIGVVIQATSGVAGYRFYQLAAGKFIVGIACGVATVSVPLYQAECAPTAIRGALINTYATIYALGTWNAYMCLYKLVYEVGSKVWLIPICIQLVAPIVILSCGWYLPESPRWLVEKGRIDEARASLALLRKGKANANIEEEINMLQIAHDEAMNLHGTSTWADCFKGTDAKRTFIATGIQCLTGAQGHTFMSSYLVVFLLQLGFTNSYEILLIIGALLFILTACGWFTQDFIGRRLLLLLGSLIQGATFITVGAVTTAFPTLNKTQSNALLAMIFIWLVGYTQTWTSIPWTISAELPSSRLRDKTLTISAWGGYAVSLIVVFVNPYMQDAGYGDLGGGVGFIYGGFAFIAFVFVYFFLPELKGIPLETVDAMFEAGISPRKMGTHPMRHEFHRADEIAEDAKIDYNEKEVADVAVQMV